MRSGSLSESECDTPDWSFSGATIHTSSDSARAISSQTQPGVMPSSLVTRMRIASVMAGCPAIVIRRTRLDARKRA